MYKIKPPKSDKDLIKQPPSVEKGIIPKLGSSILAVGVSGSGKSVLVQNLVCDDRFYGGNKSFKHIFLVSPTGDTDSIQKALKLPKECIVTNLKEAPKALEKIYEYQKKQVKNLGTHRADQICVIFDDCISDSDLMKEPIFIKCFIASRHYACTTILCSQHFTKVPRICRLQASALYFFACSRTEAETISDQLAPPQMHKKSFLQLIDDCTSEQYSFLSIYMRMPWEKRFRKNLDQIVNLEYYRQLK